MKKRKIAMVAALCLSMMLLFSACGNASTAALGYDESTGATTEEAAGSAYTGGEILNARSASTEASASDSDGTSGESTEDLSDQKLVYTCDMTLETLTFEETVSAIRQAIGEYGAFIEYESTTNDDYDWYERTGESSSATMDTYMTIRVPAEKYEDFLTSLEGSGGKVRSKSQQVENITASYNDQSVLVEALETQEERLLQMMDQAETIEDMVTIEDRLTEVQTELSQAKRTLASMDKEVTYSTVNLTVREVKVYSESVEEPTFGSRISKAVGESWANLADALKNLLVILIYILPFLILLGAVAGITLLIIFKAKKKSRKKAPKDSLPEQPHKEMKN